MNIEPPVYEIRVQGYLDPRRLRWIENLTAYQCPDGETVLVGPIQDQSILHGLLSWLYDIGIPLISVKQLGHKIEENKND
jgi:hypothetical protein